MVIVERPTSEAMSRPRADSATTFAFRSAGMGRLLLLVESGLGQMQARESEERVDNDLKKKC